jgi:hypothetical protein
LANWFIFRTKSARSGGHRATPRTIHRERVPGLARNRWLPQCGYNKTNATAWHGIRPARRLSHVPGLSTPGLVFEASVSISILARYAGMVTACHRPSTPTPSPPTSAPSSQPPAAAPSPAREAIALSLAEKPLATVLSRLRSKKPALLNFLRRGVDLLLFEGDSRLLRNLSQG